jgi:membrane protein YqaA with SNARE-associated domain
MNLPTTPSTPEPVIKKSNKRTNLIRFAALLFVIALMTLLIIYRDRIDEKYLQTLGYPGVFILTLLSNASILIPVPGWIAVSVMATILNPFLLAVVAAVAAALGELSGYILGFSGQGVAEKSKWYIRLEGYMKRWGAATVFALGIIPLPLIDLGGVIAGVMRMPIWKFLLWCGLGKFIKFLFLAYFGEWFLKLVGF